MVKRVMVVASLVLALTACNEQRYAGKTRHLSTIPPATMSLMAAKGMAKNDPILIRAYKKESELEVWKRGSDGKYALLKSYPICRWSGQLGPKVREGDRQAPEGFYAVTPAQMNPNSSYYLSFDTGYPNAFDRAHGRSGAHLMVHGSCSSRGCFAMTDEAIAEVYALAREAFAGGQKSFQFQSFPFRMTPENLAKHRYDPNIAFWRNLKEGSDHFEVTKLEPRVGVCNRRYTFNGMASATDATGPCSGDVAPALAAAVAEKHARDERRIAELVSRGTPAIRLVYEDGGQHQSFREVAFASAGGDRESLPILDIRSRRNLGDVSRPESLAMGPREIVVDSSGQPKADAVPRTVLAYASAGGSQAAVAPSAAPPRAAATAASAATPSAGAARSENAAIATKPQPARAVAATPADARPFYQRVFGDLLGRLTGAGEAETAKAVPDAPAAAPLPPRRGASAPAASRPEADAARERRAEAPRPMSGAQPVRPAGVVTHGALVQ